MLNTNTILMNVGIVAAAEGIDQMIKKTKQEAGQRRHDVLVDAYKIAALCQNLKDNPQVNAYFKSVDKYFHNHNTISGESDVIELDDGRQLIVEWKKTGLYTLSRFTIVNSKGKLVVKRYKVKTIDFQSIIIFLSNNYVEDDYK